MKQKIILLWLLMVIGSVAFSQQLNLGEVANMTLFEVQNASQRMYRLRSPQNNNFLEQRWDTILVSLDPQNRIISIQYLKQNVSEEVYQACFITYLDYLFNLGYTETDSKIIGGIPYLTARKLGTIDGFTWAIADGWIVITVNSDMRPFS